MTQKKWYVNVTQKNSDDLSFFLLIETFSPVLLCTIILRITSKIVVSIIYDLKFN